jgi:hypothetical protein
MPFEIVSLSDPVALRLGPGGPNENSRPSALGYAHAALRAVPLSYPENQMT